MSCGSLFSLGPRSIFDALVEYLRDSYKKARYVPEVNEWPPDQPKYYINLGVLHHKDGRNIEEVIAIAQRHKDGSSAIDKKLAENVRITKDVIDLFAAFDDDSAKPRSILIEGAPGIGKTVLLKEIAYRWANGAMFKDARIVILFYLRDPRFQSVTTIKGLVEYFDCLEESEVPATVKRLKQSNGEGVVFLIDGLDEYPGALHNHLLNDLVSCKIFTKSVFVITSRPFTSISLHDKVERRIEILGFGSDEREEYICRSLKSLPEKRQELKKYLKQHPILNSFVYIPFHLSVLLFLFRQGNLPETLTEMNESFILYTVYRHVEKRDLHTSCVVKLTDFPGIIYNIIYKLSELAFQGLEKNQLVFTFDEVKQVCPEVDTTPGALNGFGLLQAVQHYPIKGVGTTVSFNFLHLTMQEFLAAWYISHCPVEQQKDLLRRSFMLGELRDDKFIDPETLNDSFARMWQMYIGLVGVDCSAWKQFTSEHKFTLRRMYPLKFIYYFQCYIESQSEDIQAAVPLVFQNNTISIPSTVFSVKVLSPYHIGLLCFFLSKSTEQWKHYDFHSNYMRDVGIEMLETFWLANKDKLSCMNSLNLLGNWLTSCSKTAISNIIREGALVSLNLSYNKLGESGVCEISKALQANSTLQDVNLSNNAIRPTGIQSIAAALCQNHSIVSLSLAENDIDDGGAYEISKTLQVNSTLKKLLLSDNAIEVNGAISLANALCHNHTLEDLCLKNNKILDEGALAICDCLKSNTALKSTDLSGNGITQIGAKDLSFFEHGQVFCRLTIEQECAEMIQKKSKQILFIQYSPKGIGFRFLSGGTVGSFRHEGGPATLSRVHVSYSKSPFC